MRSSSVSPCLKVGLSMSRLPRFLMTSERLPWRLMRFRICLTVGSSRGSSSRLTLVCSGVTFSA